MDPNTAKVIIAFFIILAGVYLFILYHKEIINLIITLFALGVVVYIGTKGIRIGRGG